MNDVAKKLLEPDASGLFYEVRVSEALGVERKRLAKLRKEHLTEGADYERRENNAVALTAAGLARIEDLLRGGIETGVAGKNRFSGGLPAGKPAPDVPAGPPPRERVTIERLAQNPQILLCAGLTPPRQLAVKVRENVNFAAGMEIEIIRSGDGVWQFRNRAGSDESTVGRLPRGKGRW